MNPLASLILSALIGGLASLGSLIFLVPFLGKRLLDVPNERSSHALPTPRGGGLGLLAGLAVGVLCYWALGGHQTVLPLWVGMLAIAALGFADDFLGGLSSWLRLLFQVVVAVLFLWAQGPIDRFPLPGPADLPLGWLGFPLSVLWIVSVTNIYNFLDGIDGFAATQGVVAGVAIFFLAESPAVKTSGLLIAASCMGFLPFNWQKAKIFMGDVGSCALGFYFAAVPFLATKERRSIMVFAVGLLLWFFLSDGAYTLIRRAIKREKIWEAHRSHLYQRLVKTGLGHGWVTIIVGCAMAVLSGMTVISLRSLNENAWWFPLAMALAGFALYLGYVRYRESRAPSQTSGSGLRF